MKLGDELRRARLARKLTTSQIAAATRMKIQVVEALEREDFSSIAAPIYSKGFIKLYAEYVGLDPKPLIDDFVNRFLTQHAEPSDMTVIDESHQSTVVSSPSVETRQPEQVEVKAEAEPAEKTSSQDEPKDSDMDLFTHATLHKQTHLQETIEPVVAVEEEPPLKKETLEGKRKTLLPVPGKKAVSEVLSSAGDKIKEGLKGITASAASIVDKIKALKKVTVKEDANDFEKIRHRKEERPPLSLSTWLSIAGGVIIIVIFAFSIISRFTHREIPDNRPEIPVSLESVNSIVDPPPPYID